MYRIRGSARSAVAGVLMALLSLPLLLIDAEAHPATHGHGAGLTVMTRNVYLGGDITRPIRAAAGKTGPEALLAVGHANDELRRVVDATDFRVRSKLLAAEIAAARPDVVGLQEVALWRHGPLQLDQLGVRNATEVDYDFLTLLLKALPRHAEYRVVRVQNQTDVEAPAFQGSPWDGTATDARDVRLTVRDVLLVRRHSGVAVRATGSGQYQARLDVSLGGLPLSIVRGYVWADVVSGAKTVRVVNTHLESQSSDLALAQARELMATPATSSRRTVLLCDCNSDPLNDSIRPGNTVPVSAAYRLMTGEQGFTDQWLTLRRPPRQMMTAALSELVDDPTPAALNRRLDLILTRSRPGDEVRAVRGDVTGDEVSDRDVPTGLWPADHAGVVIRLRIR
ncbi:MAG: hypothetical protein ABWX96_16145 [Propionibacteriaceae bacterium]